MSVWANKVSKTAKVTPQQTNLEEVANVSAASGSLSTTAKVLIGVGIGTVVFLGISAAVIFTTLALTHTGPFSTTTSTTVATTAGTAAVTTVPSNANCTAGVYANASSSCTTLGAAFNCSSPVTLCGSRATTNGTILWTGSAGNYDDYTTTATLPFSLSLYGVNNSVFGVTTNGAFCIGPCLTSSFSTFLLPTIAFPNPTVFALQQDLYIFTGTSQMIRYAIVGSAPSRMFVLEYFLASAGSINSLNNVFLVMYEDIPDIVRVEYVYTYNQGVAATIGIQKTGAGPSTQYGNLQAVINNGTVLIYNTFARVYSG